MKRSRGFTLIELMVSITIMIVAVAAVTECMTWALSMSRNAEVRSDDEFGAKIASGAVVKAIRSSGLFISGGLWVNGGSTQPTMINSLWSVDGSTAAPDDFWVVIPDDNALQAPCTTAGAGVNVTAIDAGSGLIIIDCPYATTFGGATPPFATADMLVASNLGNGTGLPTGVLMTGNVFASSLAGCGGNCTSLTTAAGSGLTPQGVGSAFLPGTFIYRSVVYHYFIKLNTNLPSPSGLGRPALFRRRQAVSSTAPVFVDDTNFNDEVVQNYVEDMQLVFIDDTVVTDGGGGTGNPAQYVQANGASVTYSGSSSPLRGVRLTLVMVSALAETSGNGQHATAPSLAPSVVENHTTGGIGSTIGVVDGYRRVLFTQTIELPNAQPGSL